MPNPVKSFTDCTGSCKSYHTITSTSTLCNAPSIVTTMHRREHTIYLQLINKKLFEKKITYLHIYKIENCFA